MVRGPQRNTIGSGASAQTRGTGFEKVWENQCSKRTLQYEHWSPLLAMRQPMRKNLSEIAINTDPKQGQKNHSFRNILNSVPVFALYSFNNIVLMLI